MKKKHAVYELYELICSANIRDYMKPKYEYLLYVILGWWEDCADSEEDLIINLVDDKLGDALDNEKGRTILKRITDYAILENKYIENFTEQYNQLMGYLNPYFKFGITLSLNRKMSLSQGFDEIEKELKTIDGDFAPINIRRIGESETLMIVSEHIVPETGNKMKVYHLIFQLNDKERKEVAALARKNRANLA